MNNKLLYMQSLFDIVTSNCISKQQCYVFDKIGPKRNFYWLGLNAWFEKTLLSLSHYKTIKFVIIWLCNIMPIKHKEDWGGFIRNKSVHYSSRISMWPLNSQFLLLNYLSAENIFLPEHKVIIIFHHYALSKRRLRILFDFLVYHLNLHLTWLSVFI